MDPIPGRRPPPPPEPEIIDGNAEYELEAIRDSRFYRRQLQYLVSWKGFGYEENSWVHEKDVNAPVRGTPIPDLQLTPDSSDELRSHSTLPLRLEQE